MSRRATKWLNEESHLVGYRSKTMLPYAERRISRPHRFASLGLDNKWRTLNQIIMRARIRKKKESPSAKQPIPAAEQLQAALAAMVEDGTVEQKTKNGRVHWRTREVEKGCPAWYMTRGFPAGYFLPHTDACDWKSDAYPTEPTAEAFKDWQVEVSQEAKIHEDKARALKSDDGQGAEMNRRIADEHKQARDLLQNLADDIALLRKYKPELLRQYKPALVPAEPTTKLRPGRKPAYSDRAKQLAADLRVNKPNLTAEDRRQACIKKFGQSSVPEDAKAFRAWELYKPSAEKRRQ